MRRSAEIPTYTNSLELNRYIYKLSQGKIQGAPIYGLGAELTVLSDAIQDGTRFVRVGIPWGPQLERSYVVRQDYRTRQMTTINEGIHPQTKRAY